MKILRSIFQPEQFTGYHMFGVMTLFFGTIISVNLFLAFSAAGTWTGLMVKNSYVESQNFNEKLAVAQAHERLGWRASVASENGKLLVAIRDREGKTLQNAIVTGNIGRPVHEGEDQTLSFAQSGDRYETAFVPDPGLWRVQITAIGAKGEVWVQTIRFHIAKDGKVI